MLQYFKCGNATKITVQKKVLFNFLSQLQGHVSSNGEAVADVQFLLYPQQGVKVCTVYEMTV